MREVERKAEREWRVAMYIRDHSYDIHYTHIYIHTYIYMYVWTYTICTYVASYASGEWRWLPARAWRQLREANLTPSTSHLHSHLCPTLTLSTSHFTSAPPVILARQVDSGILQELHALLDPKAPAEWLVLCLKGLSVREAAPAPRVGMSSGGVPLVGLPQNGTVYRWHVRRGSGCAVGDAGRTRRRPGRHRPAGAACLTATSCSSWKRACREGTRCRSPTAQDGLKRGRQLATHAAAMQLVEGKSGQATDPVVQLYASLGTIKKIKAVAHHRDEEVHNKANGILTVLSFLTE